MAVAGCTGRVNSWATDGLIIDGGGVCVNGSDDAHTYRSNAASPGLAATGKFIVGSCRFCGGASSLTGRV